jgi:hypothetical protein
MVIFGGCSKFSHKFDENPNPEIAAYLFSGLPKINRGRYKSLVCFTIAVIEKIE